MPVQGARKDDGDLRAQLAHVTDELHAVHLGHVQIAHDDVYRAAGGAEHLEGGAAVAGLEHLEGAQGGEHAHERPALELVVLGDQESDLRDLHEDSSPSPRRDTR